jgi:hypothetical protein
MSTRNEELNKKRRALAQRVEDLTDKRAAVHRKKNIGSRLAVI